MAPTSVGVCGTQAASRSWPGERCQRVSRNPSPRTTRAGPGGRRWGGQGQAVGACGGAAECTQATHRVS